MIVPYLRGYGPTRFLDAATPRSGEQAAPGRDLFDLIEALHLKRPILAGYDWDGRRGCGLGMSRTGPLRRALRDPELLPGAPGIFSFAIHYSLNGHIEVDGDFAQARWYLFRNARRS